MCYTIFRLRALLWSFVNNVIIILISATVLQFILVALSFLAVSCSSEQSEDETAYKSDNRLAKRESILIHGHDCENIF